MNINDYEWTRDISRTPSFIAGTIAISLITYAGAFYGTGRDFLFSHSYRKEPSLFFYSGPEKGFYTKIGGAIDCYSEYNKCLLKECQANLTGCLKDKNVTRSISEGFKLNGIMSRIDMGNYRWVKMPSSGSYRNAEVAISKERNASFVQGSVLGEPIFGDNRLQVAGPAYISHMHIIYDWCSFVEKVYSEAALCQQKTECADYNEKCVNPQGSTIIECESYYKDRCMERTEKCSNLEQVVDNFNIETVPRIDTIMDYPSIAFLSQSTVATGPKRSATTVVANRILSLLEVRAHNNIRNNPSFLSGVEHNENNPKKLTSLYIKDESSGVGVKYFQEMCANAEDNSVDMHFMMSGAPNSDIVKQIMYDPVRYRLMEIDNSIAWEYNDRYASTAMHLDFSGIYPNFEISGRKIINGNITTVSEYDYLVFSSDVPLRPMIDLATTIKETAPIINAYEGVGFKYELDKVSFEKSDLVNGTNPVMSNIALIESIETDLKTRLNESRTMRTRNFVQFVIAAITSSLTGFAVIFYSYSYLIPLPKYDRKKRWLNNKRREIVVELGMFRQIDDEDERSYVEKVIQFIELLNDLIFNIIYYIFRLTFLIPIHPLMWAYDSYIQYRKNQPPKQGDSESQADSGESQADSGESQADSGESQADSGESQADSGESQADSGESQADSGESPSYTFLSDNEYSIISEIQKNSTVVSLLKIEYLLDSASLLGMQIRNSRISGGLMPTHESQLLVDLQYISSRLRGMYSNIIYESIKPNNKESQEIIDQHGEEIMANIVRFGIEEVKVMDLLDKMREYPDSPVDQ